MKKILIPVLMVVSFLNPFNIAQSKEVKKINHPKNVKEFRHQLKDKNPKIIRSVNKYSKKYKVNKYLVYAIIKNESNFNPRATSQDGALGLMQLMPRTLKAKGCKHPYNIDENIAAGTKHLSGLLAKYDGNEVLAVAAYNAGGGAIRRGIPKSTQRYVRRVLRTKRELQLN